MDDEQRGKWGCLIYVVGAYIYAWLTTDQQHVYGYTGLGNDKGMLFYCWLVSPIVMPIFWIGSALNWVFNALGNLMF